MIDRRSLARALASRGVADWVVVQRDQVLGLVDEAPPRLRRSERRTRWQLVVHVDTANGRGTAHVAIDASAGDAEPVVEQAVGLARAAIGPAWISTPPAAPADVVVHDAALAARDPVDVADVIARGLRRPADVSVSLAASFLREQVALVTRQGAHAEWQATLIRCEALVTVGERSLAITREARALDELELDEAITTAAADLALLARAGAPVPGPCAVIFGPDALLDGGLGVWTAFASQADAVVERQGLTRYRERMPIAPGADLVAEPLTLASDGALPLGVRSAPVGDDGDAVRRFALVERGVAAGLGLSPREAALRHRDPNGGVRNLVVAPGTWTGTPPSARTIELRRLRGLAIDPYTGDASVEIALGVDLVTGTPFTGGTLRLDLIASLARARRGATRIRRGPYDGPSSVLIDTAELIV